MMFNDHEARRQMCREHAERIGRESRRRPAKPESGDPRSRPSRARAVVSMFRQPAPDRAPA